MNMGLSPYRDPQMHSNTNAWSIGSDALPWQLMTEDTGQIQILPDAVGNCRSSLFKLDPDLSYIETQYNPRRNLTILSRISNPEPRMVLTLGLKGQSCFQANRGDDINFLPGYSTITTFNASEGKRQYQSDQPVNQLRFSMTQTWLERHFGEGAFAECFKQNAMRVVSHQPSSAAAVIAAQGLMQSAMHAKALALFRQGQTMTIVASELNHLLADSRQPLARLSPRDKRLAESARDILAAEFKTPPSIIELSKRVGTNPCKLKQLFHRRFNTTPYALLLDIRMEKAYQLLTGSHGPVGLVAEAVGYQHASNFSTAFSKYFGVSPMQVSRGR